MPADHYHNGIVFYQAKQYAKAEQEFRKDILATPQKSIAHAMLGMALHAQGKYDAAFTETKESIALDPRHAYAYYAHSWTLAAKRRMRDAEKAIVEALRYCNQESFYFARAAELALFFDRNKEGLELALTGLAIDPEDVECLGKQARAFINLGKLEEAHGILQYALKLEPENYLTHAIMGGLEIRLGDRKAAYEHYRESLRLNPNSEVARKGLLEALKVRNPIYYWGVRFFTSFSALPKPLPTLIVILVLLSPLKALAILLMLLLAFSNGIFLLLLRFDPLGKTVLKSAPRVPVSRRSKILAAACFGIALLLFGWVMSWADDKAAQTKPTSTASGSTP